MVLRWLSDEKEIWQAFFLYRVTESMLTERWFENQICVGPHRAQIESVYTHAHTSIFVLFSSVKGLCCIL